MFTCDDCGDYTGPREVCPRCGAICAIAPEPMPDHDTRDRDGEPTPFSHYAVRRPVIKLTGKFTEPCEVCGLVRCECRDDDPPCDSSP